MVRKYAGTDRQLRHWMVVLAALFCVATVAGCGPEPQGTFGSGGSAAVNLKITMPPNAVAVATPPTSLWARVQRWVFGGEAWAATVNEITGLVVRVTGPGIPTPIASPPVPVSGAVSGLVIPVTLDVPVGADRVFAVAAVDAANRPIFQGQSEPVTLVADQPSTVSIQLTDTTIRIITSTLPDGTENRSYTASLEAERGTGLTWTVQEGELPPGVRLDAGTGALLGTSSAAGKFDFRIRVTDVLGLFDEAPVTIRINPAPLPPRIITTTLPNGTVGAPYRAIIVATGGTGASTWSRIAGALPDGLNLDSATGVITGTPTTEGTATFTVRATDTTPLSDEQALTITINPAPVPPTITTTTLPDGTTQARYRAQLRATGGTGDVRWNVVAGTLPDRLSVDRTTGAITGTPSKNGRFTFTVRATDTLSLSGEKVLTITIKDAPKPPEIPPTTLPGGQVGDEYNATLTATSTNGNGTVTWRLIPAGPPAPGLQLVGATITGTPTTKGTFDFIVRATDTAGLSDEQPLFIQINDRPTPPFITTTTLPVGTVNVGYRAQLTATGGTGRITWSVIPEGAPAPGLSLDAVTGAITGTPTAPRPFSVRVRATDTKSLSSEKVLTLTIQEPIRSPEILTDSLPEGRVGAVYSAQLTATTPNGPVTWSQSGLPNGLALDRTSGAITGTPTEARDFAVTVRVTDPRNRVDEETLRIQIANAIPPDITTTGLPAGRVGDVYDATLTARSANPPITWSASGLPDGLALDRTSGAITGTPKAAGKFPVTVRATDALKLFGEKVLSLQIATATSPSIITKELPSGRVGVAYSATLTATQPNGRVTWSASGLPKGLQVEPTTGAITGTPSGAGPFSVTVRATDSLKLFGEKTLSLQIADFSPPVITTTGLPGGTVNAPYSAILRATGGEGAIAWSVVSGSLPPNLELDEDTGAITGEPSVQGSGTFTITVRATDTVGQSDSRNFTFTITDQLRITTTELPDGTVGADYRQLIRAAGGTGARTWSLVGGTLPPPGLGFDGTTDGGIVAGRPTAPGTSTFTVRVSDATGASDTQTFSVTIASRLAISTTSLPSGTAGVPYQASLGASGGAGGYTWSTVDGVVPADGLELNTEGLISGTPTLGSGQCSQVFVATYEVRDADGNTASATLSITVSRNCGPG